MPMSKNNAFLAGLICIVYLCIGPGLILLNQHILKALNFPFPMFLSGLGVLASGILAQIVVNLGFVKLERQESVQGTYVLCMCFNSLHLHIVENIFINPYIFFD